MPHASATYIYILYTKCVMQAARDTNKWQPKNKNSWKRNYTYFICCFKTTIFILVKRYVSLCSFLIKSPFIFLLCSYEKLKFHIFKYFFHVLKKPWVIANNFLLLFNRTATNFWFEYLLIFPFTYLAHVIKQPIFRILNIWFVYFFIFFLWNTFFLRDV